MAYTNKEWRFTALISYHYLGPRYLDGDFFNEELPLEPAQWADMAFFQELFDGLTTVYFGVKNFSDRQYALNANTFAAGGLYYPSAARTYYFVLKSSLAF